MLAAGTNTRFPLVYRTRYFLLPTQTRTGFWALQNDDTVMAVGMNDIQFEATYSKASLPTGYIGRAAASIDLIKPRFVVGGMCTDAFAT